MSSESGSATPHLNNPKSLGINFSSFKPLLILAQCSGLFQVHGITSADTVHFKWKSYKVAYTFFLILATLTIVGFDLVHCYHDTVTFKKFNALVFKVSAVLLLLIYMEFATGYPELLKEWSDVTKHMNGNYGRVKNWLLRMRTIVVVFLIVSIVDYISAFRCDMDVFDLEGGYNYFYMSVFAFLPYSTPLALVLMLLHLVLFLAFAFNEINILLACSNLALRFRQIRCRVECYENKYKPHDFWFKIRRDYGILSELCKSVDDNFGKMMLVCYGLNIYYIITYLFYRFSSKDEQSVQITVILSFVLLILRTTFICLYIAWVNDESTAPIPILTSTPTEMYDGEINRLLVQMSYDDVVLTGCKIFKNTRGLLLDVARTIVTYELVLIQFNSFYYSRTAVS